jgi:predicted nucleic acid-binding protein
VELVDTDVLIDVQRGHPPAVGWFKNLNQLPDVPGFVVMEFFQSARNTGEIQRATQLVAPMTIVWPTEHDCIQALSNFATLHLSHSLGLLDSLIAATAMGNNATLLTFNGKHFSAVPGLSFARPYVR